MINKVILIGNLGADPEVRFVKDGTAVATLSVATTRNWKDKSGQKQDETEWHRVIVFGAAAEFCGNYLKKGAKVYVEGRLKTNKWEDNDGNTRYTTEIIANTIQNLTPKPESGSYKQEQNSSGEEVPF